METISREILSGPGTDEPRTLPVLFDRINKIRQVKPWGVILDPVLPFANTIRSTDTSIYQQEMLFSFKQREIYGISLFRCLPGRRTTSLNLVIPFPLYLPAQGEIEDLNNDRINHCGKYYDGNIDHNKF